MFASFFLGACSDDDTYPSYSIDFKGQPDRYESLNENDDLEIPLYVTSDAGLKSAYYKVTTKDSDGNYIIGNAVNIPVEGNTLDTNVKVPVVQGMSHVVFAVFDNNDQMFKHTVLVDEVKKAPVLTLKDGIDVKNTVCVGINFAVRGQIQSDYELEKVWAVPVVDGAEKSSVETSASNTFDISVPVEAGLQYVLVKARNIYGGTGVVKLTVNKVVNEDFVDLSLSTAMPALNRGVLLKGIIASGSDIASAKYAIQKDGTLGAYKDLTLLDNQGNEAKFELELNVNDGIENVKVEVVNKSNVNASDDYKVSKIRTLENVTMSTDPADGTCFLALYEDTPVFGVDVAKDKQDRIDFYLANKGSGVQPLSPHAYGAGKAYYDASLPYISGFTTLTYAYLSSRRGKLIREEFEAITSGEELNTLLDYRIKGPKPDGENYNIQKASRRVGDTFNDSNKKDGGFLLGWGNHTHPTVSPAVVDNVAFAIFWVKSVTKKENGHWVMVFDVKYPFDDQRAPNNQGSIVPYEPYPL